MFISKFDHLAEVEAFRAGFKPSRIGAATLSQLTPVYSSESSERGERSTTPEVDNERNSLRLAPRR